MKVVLIGYMGSGKSTIGLALSKKIKLSFYDLDEYIEKCEKKSITRIFKEDGEIHFRKKEHEYLQKLLNGNDKMVLATGGGAPCYAGNLDVMLKATPNVIYLKVSIMELVKRLYPCKSKRPLIAHLTKDAMPEFFGKHLFERNNIYSKANHTIDCDGKSVEKIITEIKALLV